jgi:hypothetical protein
MRIHGRVLRNIENHAIPEFYGLNGRYELLWEKRLNDGWEPLPPHPRHEYT